MSARLRPELAGNLYRVVETWVDIALRTDDSLFTPGSQIWSGDRILTLAKLLGQQGHVTLSLTDDLAQALNHAEAPIILLAAELCYLCLLFVTDVGARSKRELVKRVLRMLPGCVDIPDHLAEGLDSRFGPLGVRSGLMRQQALSLLHFVYQWKNCHSAARELMLRDRESLVTFIDECLADAPVVQREALVHALCPDEYEPFGSRETKFQVARAFGHHAERGPGGDLDRQLRLIRRSLSAEFGETFTYWDPPVAQLWRSAPGTAAGQTIALGIAAATATLATVAVVFVSAYLAQSPGTPGQTEVTIRSSITAGQKAILLLASLFGIGLVYAGALSVDWAIDSLAGPSMEDIARDPTSPNTPGADTHRLDQFLARTQLFNHGYIILSVSIGLLMAASFYEAVYLLKPITPSPIHLGVQWRLVAVVIATVAGIFVVLQMMTYNGNRALELVFRGLLGVTLIAVLASVIWTGVSDGDLAEYVVNHIYKSPIAIPVAANVLRVSERSWNFGRSKADY